MCNLYIRFLFLFVLSAVFYGCSGGKARQGHDLQVAVQQQVAQSCMDTGQYEKTVFDLHETPTTQTDSTTQLPARETDVCMLGNDIKSAYQYYYAQPAIRDYLDTVIVGDTLIARLKADADGATPLQLQKVVREGDYVRYVESHFIKRTWLYQMDTYIQVVFDQTGRYQSHKMVIGTYVSFIKDSFQAKIEGLATYHE